MRAFMASGARGKSRFKPCPSALAGNWIRGFRRATDVTIRWEGRINLSQSPRLGN